MWNQATSNAIQTYTTRPVHTIDHVVDRLDKMGEILDGLTGQCGQNPVRAFNDLYAQITRQVRDNLVAGRYNDPDFMEILDVEFAKLYLTALDDWSHGRPVPAAWERLFILDHHGQRHTAFEGALLGVNAHINRDLTYALIRSEARAKRTLDWQGRINDFALVNDVFGERLDPIVNGLIESLKNKPWMFVWRLLDVFLGEVDEQIMVQTIIYFRERAWRRAEDFWTPSPLFGLSRPPRSSRLSANLAKAILHSHAFDSGPFAPGASCRISNQLHAEFLPAARQRVQVHVIEIPEDAVNPTHRPTAFREIQLARPNQAEAQRSAH